jgi:predicted lipoprotein with Yx(FWY)xxD motif
MKAIATLPFLIAGSLLAVPAAFAQDSATVTVATSDEYGDYLADASGMALYMFEADTQGQGGSAGVSACSGDCAVAWPPLTVTGDASGGEGIAADMLGTIEREDGTMQVTYNGWPLYYFVKDQNPGDTTGHDVEGFGAEWYLLTPAGEKAED